MKTRAGNYFRTLRPLKLYAVTLSLALWQPSLAQAEEAPEAYTMMAISDAANGKLVTQGEFSDAIKKLATASLSPDDFEAQNNLCVSYTKTGALEKAAVACNAAVAARADASRAAERRLALTRSQILREQAIALSNRGVLRAVVGNLAGAQDDFMDSVRLGKWLAEPKANLNYLATVLPAHRVSSSETG